MAKIVTLGVVLILVAGTLTGCAGSESASPVEEVLEPTAAKVSAEESVGALQASEGDATSRGYGSAVLDSQYEGALPASTQLALGIGQLQETDLPVHPQQAKDLLPLWQAIQSGSLQSNAETNAVLKQIEGVLTADQLAAIASMQLTFEDMGAWMQDRGVSFRRGEGAGGGQGAFADMTEEERAERRATRQAGGGLGGQGGGPFADMSEEEREAMRATAEAGGVTSPGGGRGAVAGGQLALMAEQVVELLSQVAGE